MEGKRRGRIWQRALAFLLAFGLVASDSSLAQWMGTGKMLLKAADDGEVEVTWTKNGADASKNAVKKGTADGPVFFVGSTSAILTPIGEGKKINSVSDGNAKDSITVDSLSSGNAQSKEYYLHNGTSYSGPYSINLQSDMTAPTITVSSYDDTNTLVESDITGVHDQTFHFEVAKSGDSGIKAITEDDLSGVKSLTVSQDGGVTSDISSGTVRVGISKGPHILVFTATDKLENVSTKTVDVYNWVKDKIVANAPAVQLTYTGTPVDNSNFSISPKDGDTTTNNQSPGYEFYVDDGTSGNKTKLASNPKDAGTYYVKAKQERYPDAYSLETESDYTEFTIAQANAPEYEAAPTLKSDGAIYTGQDIELINAGTLGTEATKIGAVFRYYLWPTVNSGYNGFDTNTTTPDQIAIAGKGNWTNDASNIKATSSGYWNIYYYMEGGTNYKDSKVGCLTATIVSGVPVSKGELSYKEGVAQELITDNDPVGAWYYHVSALPDPLTQGQLEAVSAGQWFTKDNNSLKKEAKGTYHIYYKAGENGTVNAVSQHFTATILDTTDAPVLESSFVIENQKDMFAGTDIVGSITVKEQTDSNVYEISTKQDNFATVANIKTITGSSTPAERSAILEPGNYLVRIKKNGNVDASPATEFSIKAQAEVVFTLGDDVQNLAKGTIMVGNVAQESPYSVFVDLSGATPEGTVGNDMPTIAPMSGYIVPKKADSTPTTGWFVSAAENAEEFLPSTEITAAQKVYAKTELEKYTITIIDELNGTYGSDNKTEYDITDTVELVEPVKNGYTFEGWTGEGYNSPTKNVSFGPNASGNRTYTANYSLNVYEISYSLNGGKLDGSQTPEPREYNIEEDTFVLDQPVRDGYDFTGWTGGDGNGPFEEVANVKDVTIPKGTYGDLSFEAGWKLSEFPITYELNGGTEPMKEGSEPQTQVPANPDKYTILTPSFPLEAPTKQGYDFTGWTWEGQDEPVKDVQITQGSTGEKKYTANWSANILTITYNGLNPELDDFDGNENPTTFTADDEFIPPIVNPKREGQEFLGWTTTTTGFTIVDKFKVTIPAGTTIDIELTATWGNATLVGEVTISKLDPDYGIVYGQTLEAKVTSNYDGTVEEPYEYHWYATNAPDVALSTTKTLTLDKEQIGKQIGCRANLKAALNSLSGFVSSEPTEEVGKRPVAVRGASIVSRKYKEGDLSATISSVSLHHTNSETYDLLAGDEKNYGLSVDVAALNETKIAQYDNEYVGENKTVYLNWPESVPLLSSGKRMEDFYVLTGLSAFATVNTGVILYENQSLTNGTATIGKGQTLTDAQLAAAVGTYYGSLSYSIKYNSSDRNSKTQEELDAKYGTYVQGTGYTAPTETNLTTVTIVAVAAAVDLNKDNDPEYEEDDCEIAVSLNDNPTQTVVFTGDGLTNGVITCAFKDRANVEGTKSPKVQIKLGEGGALLTGTPNAPATITYSSSNTNVATVNKTSGAVTFVGIGSAEIMAVSSDLELVSDVTSGSETFKAGTKVNGAAGSYTLHITGSEVSSESLPMVNKPVPGGYAYTGETIYGVYPNGAQIAANAESPVESEVNDSFKDDEGNSIGYTLSGNSAAAAGEYTAHAILNDGYTWPIGATIGGTEITINNNKTQISIPWKILKAANAQTDAPALRLSSTVRTSNTDGEISIIPGEFKQGRLEYANSPNAQTWTKIDGEFFSDSVISSLTPGTYYFRYQGDENHEPSPSTSGITIEPVYTISFSTYKGTVTPQSITVLENRTIPADAITISEEPVGYELAGWYTNTRFEEDSQWIFDYHGSTLATTVTQDRTLYAKWSPISYGITYIGKPDSDQDIDNEPVLAAGNPETFTVQTAAFTIKNPTRPGYVFEGWKIEGEEGKTVSAWAVGTDSGTITENYKTVTITPSLITKATASGLTLTANWKANTIKFKKYDDAVISPEASDVGYSPVNAFAYKQMLDGYTWYTAAGGVTQVSDFSALADGATVYGIKNAAVFATDWVVSSDYEAYAIEANIADSDKDSTTGVFFSIDGGTPESGEKKGDGKYSYTSSFSFDPGAYKVEASYRNGTAYGRPAVNAAAIAPVRSTAPTLTPSGAFEPDQASITITVPQNHSVYYTISEDANAAPKLTAEREPEEGVKKITSDLTLQPGDLSGYLGKTFYVKAFAVADSNRQIRSEIVGAEYSVTSHITAVSLNKTNVELDASDTENNTIKLTPSFTPASMPGEVEWSYQTGDDSIAEYTLDEDGISVIVTAKDTGVVELKCTVKNEASVDPAVCKITVTGTAPAVHAKGLEIDPEELTVYVGRSATATPIKATVSPEEATDKSVSYESADPETATVSASGVVRGVKAGTTTIRVTANDKTNIIDPKTCAITVLNVPLEKVAVNPAAPTLQVDPTDNVNLPTVDLEYVLTPADATVKSAVWSLENGSEYVELNTETGLVTGKAAGEATIRVTVTPEDGKAMTADAVVTVIEKEPIIAVTEVSLDQDKLELELGDAEHPGTAALTATVLPANATEPLNINWVVSPANSVVKVDKDPEDPKKAVVTALGTGSATITFSASNDPEVAAKSAVCPVSVVVKPTALEIENKIEKLRVGDELQLRAKFTPENTTNKNVAWESDNPDILEITSGGRLKAKAAGEAKITLTSEELVPVEGGDPAPLTDEMTVSVSVAPQSLAIDPAAAQKLGVGESVTLKPVFTPADTTNQNVTWTVNEEGSEIVEITADETTGEAIVRALAVGTAVVTVTSEDTVPGEGEEAEPVHLTAEIEIDVVVRPTALSIASDPAELTQLKVNETAALTAVFTPGNTTNKKVSWSVDRDSIIGLEVNEETGAALITARAAGTAVITLTSAELIPNPVDGGEPSFVPLTATLSIDVTDDEGIVHVTGITITSPVSSPNLEIGETFQFVAEVSPENATNKNITWEAADPSVVSVSDTGLVTALAPGSSRVTATTEDGGYLDYKYVYVMTPDISRITALHLYDGATLADGAEISMKEGEYKTLTLKVEPETAENRSVFWTTGNRDVATVKNGIITAVGGGIAAIRVETPDGIFAECYVRIPAKPEKVVLDKNNLGLRAGETMEVEAFVLPEGADFAGYRWSSSAESVFTAAPVEGFPNVCRISGAAPGTGKLTVSAVDSKDKVLASAEANVKVVAAGEDPNQALTELTVTPAELSLKVWESAQLTAALTPADATNVSTEWTSSDNDCVQVSPDGTVRAVRYSSEPVTITAMATQEGGVDLVRSATCTVSMKEEIKPQTILLDPKIITLTAPYTCTVTDNKTGETSEKYVPGGSVRLVPKVYPEDAANGAIFWKVSDSHYVQIDEDGTITALQPTGYYDPVIVTATSALDNSVTATATVYVSSEPYEDDTASLKNNVSVLEESTKDIWIGSIPEFTYTGNPIKPRPSVYYGTLRLSEGRDFTYSWSNNTNAGGSKQPAVKVKLKGNYSGTVSKTFTINPLDLSGNAVSIYGPTALAKQKKNGTYTTQKLKPSFYVENDDYYSVNLKKKDYTLAYPDTGSGAYAAPGEWTINITAGSSGNVKGSASVKMQLVDPKDGIDISKATVSIDPQTSGPKDLSNILFTARRIYPDFVLTLDGKTIPSDYYTTGWTNNYYPGTATVYFYGNGSPDDGGKMYVGTKVFKFKIKKNPVSLKSDDMFSLFVGGKFYEVSSKGAVSEDEETLHVNYSRSGVKPHVALYGPSAMLYEGKDYKLKYTNDLTNMKGKVVITGKGAFKDTLEVEYVIDPLPLSEMNILIDDIVAGNKPINLEKATKVTILDRQGKKLKAKTEYVLGDWTIDGKAVSGPMTLTAGTLVTFRIKTSAAPKKFYTGDMVVSLRVIDKSQKLSAAKAGKVPKTWSGQSDVQMDSVDLSGLLKSKSGVALRQGIDFEVICYQNNLKTGTGKIVVRGIGAWGGLKTIGFKINKAKKR